jgi:ABC-2 type transport system permease protein
VLIQSLIVLQPAWGVGKTLFLLAVLAGSFLMIGSVNYITNCSFFWDPGASVSFPLLVQNSIDFARYPITLYARVAQVFVTWILPFAFVSYYPTLLLLDKMQPAPLISYLSPLAGVLVAWIASLIWSRCLVLYQGTGS